MTLGIVVALMIPAVCWPQSNVRAEILVLGTYHMANPGHDIHNMKADDVLAPKRQHEIEQLVSVLEKFQPTKIAIEAAVGSKQVDREYADYLGGKYTLSRNETNQIGYRLAKKLGHRAIYPVDEEGDFPWQRVVNYAKANGLAAKLNKLQGATGEQVSEENNFLLTHTILEMFDYMNSDSMVAADVATYYAFVPYGDPDDYAGPDLLAAWYKRNIRIYHNIVNLIESPNDRILVIFGAGHLGWLRQDVANDATVKLRKLAEFVPQP